MRRPMPDVIVLLPGILGSVLARDGRNVWAPSVSAGIQWLVTLGDSINTLALGDDPPEADDLGDGIEATRLVPDVHLIPSLWKIDGYTRIAQAIGASFTVTPGKNYFEFPYDWRRDNRVAARRLARQAEGWLGTWREESGNASARLILIGHSMGGLVGRYFLEALEGWRETKALITFGTPYAGSLNALGNLVGGVRLLRLLDLSPLVRSLTSVYQLLPTYSCLDVGGPRLVRIADVPNLAHLSAARLGAAQRFHEEIDQAVERHRADDTYKQDRYRLHPVVGITQPTMQSARVGADGNVTLLAERDGVDEGGDGTVPRVSATPPEARGDGREMFVATRHASIQNADEVITHVQGALENLYVRWDTLRAAAGPSISLGLALEDAYGAGEPIALRLRADPPPLPALEVVVTDVATGHRAARAVVPAGADGWATVRCEPLAAGVYRVTARGAAGVQGVADIFAVLDGA